MRLAVVAADYTPGEADQLRRDMAAWRKSGRIEHHRERLVSRMQKKGIAPEFAERVFEQIRGFGEYGFPESHAASFALLVYASCWLKRHHPAEFTAALLNSQPMGFYAPAQLIRDVREHGVRVLPIDANHSAWDCSIESGGSLRLGLRLVSGIGRPDADRLRAAVVSRGPFHSLIALWRHSGVKVRTMRRLAAADGFGSMSLSRQQALWQARLLRDDILPLFDQPSAVLPSRVVADRDGYDRLPALTPQRQVVLDYDATGLSLKAHPVSFARERLGTLGARACADLADAAKTPEGELITVAGLVLVRQRPGTANDVTFITLEDETGIANLIIWYRVYQKFRREAGSRLLIATGRVQRQGQVVHLIVTQLRGLDQAIEGLHAASRNFH